MNRAKSTIGVAMGLALMASVAFAEVGPDGPKLPIARRDAPSAVARATTEAARPVGQALEGETRYGRVQPDPQPAPPAAIAKPQPVKTTVWVPGRFEATTTTVLEPGEQREVWIAPVFRNGYDPVACRPTREMVRAGRWDYVREPLRVARRETLQWSPGYEQTVGEPVARGTLDAPAPKPAPAVAKAAPRSAPPAAAPVEDRKKKSKPGFDLSGGWAVAPRAER